MHYQKLHFRTPVIHKGGIIWHTIVCQTILGVYFREEGYIFDCYTAHKQKVKDKNTSLTYIVCEKKNTYLI